MPSLVVNDPFRRNKNNFFSEMRPINAKSTAEKISKAEALSSMVDYSFLLDNQRKLETEFTGLFNSLKRARFKNEELFWLYCYYCASLLETFYGHNKYNKEGKEQEFTTIKMEIQNKLEGRRTASPSEPEFIDYLLNSFVSGFKKVIKSPVHLSHLRDEVVYANLLRIYSIFCRLALTQGFLLAKDYHLIEKLDALLGTHTDVQKIISVLKAPFFVLSYFSVFLFLARLMIDAGMLVKHTFFPSEGEKGQKAHCELVTLPCLPQPDNREFYKGSYVLVEERLYYIDKQQVAQELSIKDSEKEHFFKAISSIQSTTYLETKFIEACTGHTPEETTAWERFSYELYKRHCNFANDIVWAVVNGLTNFNYVFHISAPVASYITLAFLIFDVGMALYKCHLAEEEYKSKKAQYLKEIDDYNHPDALKSLSKEERRKHIELLNHQLFELEIDWKKKESTFLFVASAAGLLALGFGASLIVCSPALIFVSFVVCTLAVAMYLSIDSYSLYKEKSLYLERAQARGENLQCAMKEYETARNDFIFNMVKNTVVPAVLIATFAICWPAALVLTAVYLGYELYHAYSQHQGTSEAKQLALDSHEHEGFSCAL